MDNARLRIAQVSPVGAPVKPGIGESVEQLVSLITEELLRRGHDVTLFASGDSVTSGELRYTLERAYEYDEQAWEDRWDWHFTESMHVSHAYACAHEFDVVHSHSYHYALPLTPFVQTPNVQTHHVEMSPEVVRAYNEFSHVHLVVISAFQGRHFPARPNLELIHNGIDTDSFPAGSGGGGYLLFLGRMIRSKGPREAVSIAMAAGMPIVLAGPPAEDFDEEIVPLIDGKEVQYVGQVDAQERNALLADAAALIYPLTWGEPFGLVPVEAMACGTPVVATEVGAVPELVEPGLTGYLGRRPEDLPALVPRALELDRDRIRRRAAERFNFRRMVDQHEALYRRAVAARSS